MTDDKIALIENQLSKIIKSRHFRSAKQASKFLTYVVQQTLEGKGGQLKQYTIAIEALDFPDDFDSDINPAVRIIAGRVRERLQKYYENEGVDDNLVINIEKGGYSTLFEERKTASPVAAEDNIKPKKSRWLWLYIVPILAVLVFVYSKFHHEIAEFHHEAVNSHHENTDLNSIPLVDVMPFEDLSDIPRGRMLTKGIRYQLLTELSQFKMIRVRDVSVVKNQANDIRSANYTIKGGLLVNNKTLQMTVHLQDAASSEVLWTKNVDVAATDDGFNELIFEGVKGIMSKITGPRSVMQQISMKRLRDRLEQDKGGVTSSYECVLLFYDFDNTKNPQTEREARKCLAEYTSKGVENSSLWATHGFMLVLDWGKQKDKSDDRLLNQSLKSFKNAIRIDPNNAQAYEFYGNYLMAIDRFDEAMVYYEKARKLNPSKPDIHVMIGWKKVNEGDWENGIKEIREGIAMSYQAPGWFHIPVAVDAFRREDFKESLQQAQIILSRGDTRGIALALAPAIKLGRNDLVKLYTKEYSDYRKDDLAEPLREVGNFLKTPKVLERYTETLKPVLESLNQK